MRSWGAAPSRLEGRMHDERDQVRVDEVCGVLAHLPPDFFATAWRSHPGVVRGALPWAATLVEEAELDAFEADHDAAPPSWRTGSVGRIGPTSYIGNAECLNERLARLCTAVREEFRWPHGE